MPFKIIVFAKQVPDTKNITGEAMKPDGTVNRGALPAIFNPEDLNALEMALQIKEKHGAEITVLSMGPPAAAELLREALYRGADRTILLTHRLFAGSDTLATSYALAKGVQSQDMPQLILCGRQAIDGDTAQVGPQTAEKLDIPQITYVEEITAIDEKSVTVRRVTENVIQVLKSPLPVLLTVVSSANHPRPPSVKRVMTYKNARTRTELMNADEDYVNAQNLEDEGLLIEEWGVDTIGADAERLGIGGSPTKVKKVTSVVISSREVKQVEARPMAIAGLVEELINEHVIG